MHAGVARKTCTSYDAFATSLGTKSMASGARRAAVPLQRWRVATSGNTWRSPSLVTSSAGALPGSAGVIGWASTSWRSATRLSSSSSSSSSSPAAAADSSCTPPDSSPSSSSSSSPSAFVPAQGGKYVVASVAAACALGLAAVALSSKGEQKSIDLKPISEEVFERADNLFVFFLDEAGELMDRQEEIQTVMKTLDANTQLHRLRYFYNVRKEGDPPLPEPQDTASPSGSASQAAPPRTLRVMMYKGQRKAILRVSTSSPGEQVDEVVKFFTPVTEDLTKVRLPKDLDVPRVSGETFDAEVVATSSPAQPVLLQMYEDTCFLCFLMRPFINSLAKHLKENGIPLRIKRLNLERNDFPDRCPVARGTPTFVLFRGPDVPPAKWDEFKPHDLVEKIKTEFPDFADEVYTHMDELQKLVSTRLQLFTQVVMWSVELQKLERQYNTRSTPRSKQDQPDSDPTEDASFSTVVTELMLKDMKKHDGIRDNLQHLQKEVDELEHDASLMGVLLAKEVAERERAQGLVE